MRRIVLGWLCMFSLAGCGAGGSWRELSLPAEGVRAEMPAAWTESNPEGDRRFTATHAKTDYMVSVAPLPREAASEAEARTILAGARDGAAGQVSGTRVTHEREIAADGRPGLEFHLRGRSDDHVRCRVYVVGDALVSLIIAYRGTPRSEADITRFFDSFALTGGSEASPTEAADATGSRPAPTPAPADGDDRTVWRYENAPSVFSDQASASGTFEKQGEGWVERAGGQTIPFREVGRSPDFVELEKGNGFRVRLFYEHSEYKPASSPGWKRMYPGRWERP